jgi:hypothetical protein
MYQTDDGLTKIEVTFDGETVWLTQIQMAALFQRERSVITKHISNIFNEGELDEKSNVQNLHIANSDKPVTFYNLDVIISVGYRVKSLRGTQFRIWASGILKEYLRKGFAMNDALLKSGGGNYFEELLERIRDIRSSEKMFYRKTLEIYATSIDYDPRSETHAKPRPAKRRRQVNGSNKRNYSSNSHSRTFLWIIPSRLKSNSSKLSTYLGQLSRMASRDPNSRAMVSGAARR